ncbi:DUF58 domain-containing protein [Acidobacteria bacterium AH-259-D05]|nr:DUF58 domain-containing protein [Acidobacteria bacterium AH-259-D05]
MPSWVNIKGIKEFFWPILFLVSAFVLAVFSSMARHNGQFYAASFLAIVSLIFAFIVCVTLVPKLLARIQLDFLMNLRFFRFTKRGATFILIVFIISFATFNTGNNLLILILSFLLASLIVSGIVANLVLFGLKISLSVPKGIHAKQKAIFLITLHNLKKFFPSFALLLKGEKKGKENSQYTDFFVQEKNFPYVRAGEKLRLRLQCEFGRRGVYPVEGFEIKTTFPFGFFWRGRELDACGNIVVYPEIHDVSSFFSLHPNIYGVEEKNRKGSSNELYNIRHYQAGDSARFVHWRSTAKLGSLMIKDFVREEEVPLNVLFSIYLPDPSHANLQQFEKAVSCVASLGRYYRLNGHKFKLDTGEFEVEVDGRSEEYETYMEYLAQVQPADQIRLDLQEVTQPCILFAAGDSIELEGVPRVDYLQL